MFLNNNGLLVKLEDSTHVQRKERKHVLEKFIVWVILQGKTHKIRNVLEEFTRRTHPNKATCTLLTSSITCNGDILVAWMLRHQETKELNASGITFAAAFNNETNGVSNLNGNCEIRAYSIEI